MPDDDLRRALLQLLWQEVRLYQPAETITSVPAASRALQAGAAPADIVAAMHHAAYEAIFGMLEVLDERMPANPAPGAPGWVLLPVIQSEDGETVLGDARELAGLHEDFLTADPTGLEGADFFA